MLKRAVDLAEAWEAAVQGAWASHVLAVADRYGTDPEVQLRMLRAGWALLRVLTWPASLGRWIELKAEGTGPA